MSDPLYNKNEKDELERLHDLKTIYSDFRSALLLIKSGYRFNDENGTAALGQLEKALNLLKNEIDCTEQKVNTN